MNIVKPAIYTEQTCALSAGLNRLQWALRDRKPNAEVIDLANSLQREMVKLSQYIVTEYKGR
jgi:hypothetical protein